ncbi:outer membrane protein [Shinella zoogloeoides]|uniref:Outer membrane beta-barrel protein n=1 Tax=Shinella zoogloeoides TaxID=352475 RepID=A0A6N8TFL2_SHIZO|nr:outer membrane protein [Shinella zoogloeoides]MXN99919.1 outer membrane beta-barrel protein [Shinella zoogloeoides]UEX80598.1 porin family protein [Shinella zoogloeoides]
MRKVLSSVVAVMLTGTSGYAADMYEPQVIEAPVQETVVQTGGWYLRGDAGWSYNKLRGAHYFQGSNKVDKDFDFTRLRSGFVIGGGVGYQINDHLRTDVTLDYMFKSNFRGGTTGWCGATVCNSSDRSSLSALTLLANAYVDIGHYGAFTPYVGAGIGGSYVRWNKLNNTICNDPGNPGCNTTEHDGKKSWRFTYALMAGTAIDLTCNLKADVGYRFRHVTKGDMFGYKLNGGPGYDKGYYSHEARAGLRYSFSGCETATYIPPADIPVYK